MLIQWVVLVVFGIWSGKCMSYQATLQEVSVEMAKRHGLGVQPIQYQNALTPPWLTKAVLFGWLGIVGSVVWIWYEHGWQIGVGALIAGILVPGLVHSILPPRRGSVAFLRNAFHVMTNRHADYAKSGDHLRAEAMDLHIKMLLDIRPDLAGSFLQK